MGQIPREPPGYQLREDLLDQLSAAADSERRLTVVHALTGLRGVGKTQLAAAYARDRIAQGWPVVAWLTGETPDQVTTALADLAGALRLTAPGEDTITAARRALAWLETSTRRSLLVIDNATDPDALSNLLPTGGRTHVVITTTNRAFANSADALDVTVFTPEQATAYLAERTRLNDPDGALALAEELGRLPLALAQAAWLITSQGKTYAQILHDVKTTPLSQVLRATPGSAYPHGAGQIILLTTAQAETADPTGHTTTVLTTLALLSPAGIPRNLLTNALANLPNPVPIPAVDHALQILSTTSLITYSLDNTTLLMHRLTQRALRDRATHLGSLPTALEHLATALTALTFDNSEAWPRRAEGAALIEQITALTTLAAAASTNATADATPATRRTLLELRGWALRHLIAVNNYTQAVALGEPLAADAAVILGPEHQTTFSYRDRLASALQYVGRQDEAVTLFEALVADRQRVSGADDPDVMVFRHNLAIAYRDAGRVDEAITQFETVLANRDRGQGLDHPSILITRNQLAVAYRSAGRVNEAITLLEAVLADQQRVLGSDHPDTLVTRYNLAFAHLDADPIDEVIPIFEAVVADHQRILGSDHPDTLFTGYMLAGAYQNGGRVNEAITLLEAVLAEQQRVLGPDHPQTGSTRRRLAEARTQAERSDSQH